MLNYEDLEIFGFEAVVPEVECAAARVFVRVIESDSYFRLSRSITADSVRLLSRADISSMEEEGRITLLPSALDAMPDALALYVSQVFLDAAGTHLSDSLLWSDHTWQRLGRDDRGLWVTCAPRVDVIDQMDRWAHLLMEKSTNLLAEYLADDKPEMAAQAQNLLDLALEAANDASLRERLQLRLGLALLPTDSVDEVFNLYRVVAAENPAWTWSSYHQQIKALAELLRLRGSLRSTLKSHMDDTLDGTAEDISHKYALSLLKNVKEISEVVDGKEQLYKAQAAADEHRETLPMDQVPNEYLETLVQYLRTQMSVPLSDRDILVLAGEPAFYLTGVVKRLGEPNVSVDCIEFGKAVEFCDDRKVRTGKISQALLPHPV